MTFLSSTIEPIPDAGSGIEIGAIRMSPLMVSDRLLTLAKDADRAGLKREAGKLLRLALQVYDRN